jgi:hypothetical protein
MRKFVDCQGGSIRLDAIGSLQLLTHIVGQEPATVGHHPGQSIADPFIKCHGCLCGLA